MGQLFKHSYLKVVALVFSITSITTSFLGVSLGLVDFLMDAFKLRESKNGRICILMAVYMFALLLSFTTLRVFYISLKYGAGIASIFLLIFLPTLLSQFSKLEENFNGAIALTVSPLWVRYFLIGFSFFAIVSCVL